MGRNPTAAMTALPRGGAGGSGFKMYYSNKAIESYKEALSVCGTNGS